MTTEAPWPVLFVCTANISRSPYLERRAAQLAARAERGDGAPARFSSAGVRGLDGEAMDEQMAAELRDRGGDAEGFASRALTGRLVADAGVVLTAESAHRRWILAEHPSAALRTFTVGQFADALDDIDPGLSGAALLADDAAVRRLRQPGGEDIADPYGRGPHAARKAADAIDALLAVVLPRLTGAPGPR